MSKNRELDKFDRIISSFSEYPDIEREIKFHIVPDNPAVGSLRIATHGLYLPPEVLREVCDALNESISGNIAEMLPIFIRTARIELVKRIAEEALAAIDSLKDPAP